jgi:hypothetical protein
MFPSMNTSPRASAPLLAGWAHADLTPDQPVLLSGQFHARRSEGVLDPITATVLALDTGSDHALFVSCDLVVICDALRDAVRDLLNARKPEFDPLKVILHATHTHTAPECRKPEMGASHSSGPLGVELDPYLAPDGYLAFAAKRIEDAILAAWQSRKPGDLLYGQGFAVVGRNRRWADESGVSTMYGNTDTPGFSHIEGYEDHSVNLMATRDAQGALTGLVVNVPCPSQAGENGFQLSADYWHDTRAELRRRLGDHLFVLGQCSAAGDQSPHLLYDKKATARMLELTGRSARQEIAQRLSDAVEQTLRHIAKAPVQAPVLVHHVETLEIPLAALTEADAERAGREAEASRLTYEEEMRKLEAHPELKKEPRWYVKATFAHRRMSWFKSVIMRYRNLKEKPTMPAEIHVIRLGDMVFASTPFEYYLDFGVHIKARSKAVQTFLVQLAGPGTYVPSRRSMAGGGYGSIPASNPVAAEGGWKLAHRTVAIIDQLWAK